MSTEVKCAFSSVERVYEELRALAINFEMLPGDRVNEVELAKRFGVSRTPLREALNRLTADGFLSFVPSKGFFRRKLEIKEVVDLYELRLKLELGGAELACERATPEKVAEIRSFLDMSMRDDPARDAQELVALDERFHEMIADLAGNAELLRTLIAVNARIRFIRWINMESSNRPRSQAEHLEILEAIAGNDSVRARTILINHISKRQDQIAEFIRTGYAAIYTR